MRYFRDSTTRSYDRLLTQLLAAPNNKSLKFSYVLNFPNTSRQFFATAYNHQGVITGDEQFSTITSYLKRLDYLIAHPEGIQIANGLHKLKEIFREKGRLKIYNVSYDLDSITPAELNSASKHIRLLQAEILDNLFQVTVMPM